MEKVKFSNDKVFEIKANGVTSDDTRLRIGIVASDLDLAEVESLVTNKDNVNRIELLSETDEALRIYSGYTVLTSLEKKKNMVISITNTEAVIDEETGEIITEASSVTNRGDVIYISLKKANETEERFASLEETVDTLIMSSLM